MVAVKEENFIAAYRLDPEKPPVDPSLKLAWQHLVNALAKAAQVPAALVMAIHPRTIEVAVTSTSSADNPYEAGEQAELGEGLYCETVLRSRQPLWVPNALADPDWDHNPDIKLGMTFYYGLPILWPDGSSFGTICILDRQNYELTDLVKELMQVMRQGIEAGLQSLYLTYQALETSAQLNQVLETTIAALVNTMSYRDPYTASHQRRVAELSVAIAKAMGLSEDFCHGLYLGGLIHDIGKIYVPSEILCRPGQLTAAEFELVKSHPIVGAEIIRNINFPWPIYEMILQHHERLDGSGYPHGLMTKDIILEARIIMVADVVEAISSHRPYRSALGMVVALDELQIGRDRIYDPKVVDTCEKVLRENRLWQSWTF